MFIPPQQDSDVSDEEWDEEVEDASYMPPRSSRQSPARQQNAAQEADLTNSFMAPEYQLDPPLGGLRSESPLLDPAANRAFLDQMRDNEDQDMYNIGSVMHQNVDVDDENYPLARPPAEAKADADDADDAKAVDEGKYDVDDLVQDMGAAVLEDSRAPRQAGSCIIEQPWKRSIWHLFLSDNLPRIKAQMPDANLAEWNRALKPLYQEMLQNKIQEITDATIQELDAQPRKRAEIEEDVTAEKPTWTPAEIQAEVNKRYRALIKRTANETFKTWKTSERRRYNQRQDQQLAAGTKRCRRMTNTGRKRRQEEARRAARAVVVGNPLAAAPIPAIPVAAPVAGGRERSNTGKSSGRRRGTPRKSTATATLSKNAAGSGKRRSGSKQSSKEGRSSGTKQSSQRGKSSVRKDKRGGADDETSLPADDDFTISSHAFAMYSADQKREKPESKDRDILTAWLANRGAQRTYEARAQELVRSYRGAISSSTGEVGRASATRTASLFCGAIRNGASTGKGSSSSTGASAAARRSLADLAPSAPAGVVEISGGAECACVPEDDETSPSKGKIVIVAASAVPARKSSGRKNSKKTSTAATTLVKPHKSVNELIRSLKSSARR